MSTRSRRRRGHTHTHDTGSAGRESGGRPQGSVSGGLLQSPFEHRQAPPGELEEQPWAAAWDWFSFVCSSCGEEVYVARDTAQPVCDFYLMCTWIYGAPAICSECRQEARNG